MSQTGLESLELMKSISTNKLTVLMAVHNGANYLGTAIDSILSQSHSDFTFLVVDDASTDDTRDIIKAYSDKRIETLFLDNNLGQTGALNVGLKHSSTEWIARMDADDYSAPTRFEEQLRIIEEDPNIKCVGTDAWTFKDHPEIAERVIRKPSDHLGIMRELLRGSPIIHGSIIVNREALLDIGAYNENYRYANDVELYDRLLSKYYSANVPKQLLGIRTHDEQGSRTKESFDEVIEIFENRLVIQTYSPKEQAIVRSTLSRFYLVRACIMLSTKTNLMFSFKDVIKALRVSPFKFVWNFGIVSIFFPMSESVRGKIKRFLTPVLRNRNL